ncbi:MAG TPA: T9SS type A sorting domain-containing protein [Chitinophagales bacterium]|nr:T9SS type A sorting domain-containing protein [Chitinophagales bacterium]
MKFILFNLFLTLLSIEEIGAQAPQFEWAKSAPFYFTGWYDYPLVKADNFGNFYLFDGYDDSIVVAGITLTGPGLMVAKFSGDGTFKWVRSISGTPIYQDEFDVDQFSNVYISSGFNNDMIFGNITLHNQGTYPNSPSTFIAKYDSSGNFQWVKEVHTLGGDGVYPGDIDFDAWGNIYLCGTEYANDPIEFDNILIDSSCNELSYIVKYNSQGEAQWATPICAWTTAWGAGLAVSSDGESYFSNGTVTKLNPEGSLDWKFDQTNIDGGSLIAVNGNGQTYSGGYGDGYQVIIGSDTLEKNGADFVPYLAKLDENGNFDWAKSFVPCTACGQNIMLAFDLNNRNNIVSTGYCWNCHYDTFYVEGLFFVCEVDSAGKVKWVKGAEYDHGIGTGLSSSPRGDTFVSGYYADSIKLDSIILYSSAPWYDYFFGKLRSTCPVLIDPITVSPVCSGSSFTLNYEVNTAFNPGNIFTAELSNLNGSFNSPVVIGTITSDSSGSISVTIPFSIPSGLDYRIRIVSSSPYTTDCNNGINIPINTILTSGPATICKGDSVTIGAANADSYQWSPATGLSSTTGASVLAFPETTTVYSVTATSACGIFMDSIKVQVRIKPEITISSNGITEFCAGDTVVLYAINNDSSGRLEWYRNDDFVSDDATFTATKGGDYYCVIYDYCGVDTSNIIHLNKQSTFSAFITLIGNNTICQGNPAELITNSGSGFHHKWLKNDSIIPGAHNYNYFATEDGSYSCIVWNICKTDTTVIVEITTDTFYATLVPFDTILCMSGSAFELINGDPPGGSYSGDGVIGDFFYPGIAGAGAHAITYSYTDTFGCLSTSTQNLDVEVCTNASAPVPFSFTISPNPFTVEFIIRTSIPIAKGNLEIFNVLGEKILEQSISNKSSLSIHAEKFFPSVYFLMVRADGNTFSGKIIKMNGK